MQEAENLNAGLPLFDDQEEPGQAPGPKFHWYDFGYAVWVGGREIGHITRHQFSRVYLFKLSKGEKVKKKHRKAINAFAQAVTDYNHEHRSNISSKERTLIEDELCGLYEPQPVFNTSAKRPIPNGPGWSRS